MEPTFGPEDFADLMGEDLVLVGGQAVNFWGLYFAEEEPRNLAGGFFSETVLYSASYRKASQAPT